MSRLYDTIEPSVINEEMLREAVHEQGPKEHAEMIAKDEGLDYIDITKLRLDYRNILKIDNLWEFTNLVKLQLDNNIIEKIEGLDLLVNLEWLDLSFNNIESIEGLECLTKLRDLSVYNNRITKLENLDNLKDLHIFSVGNNCIEELEQLVYMRKFEELRTLNASGNPICEHPDYKLFAIAYLPHLVYLDFRLVDADFRNKANTKYELKLAELLDSESKEKAARIFDEKEQELFKEHEKAFVERLNTNYLFEKMFNEDPEGNKLSYLPGIIKEIEEYKVQFIDVCRMIFNFGMEQSLKRDEEVVTFFSCLEEAKQDNKLKGVKQVENFLIYQKTTFKSLLLTTDSDLQDQQTAEYNEKVTELWDSLMGYEMRLVDQLEEIIMNFERNLQDFVSVFVEKVQELVGQLRDLQNNFNEHLLETAIATLEKVVKNEDITLTDDLHKMFVDKDTVVNAVSASHDFHLVHIDNQEDRMLTSMKNFVANLVSRTHKQEVDRNRDRVHEISMFVDHMKQELDSLDLDN